MVWLFVFCAVIIVLVILLALPLEIRVRFEHIKKDDQGTLEIRFLFGLIRIRRELTKLQAGITEAGPTVGVKGESPSKKDSHRMITASDVSGLIQSVGPLYGYLKHARRILLRMVRHVHIEELELHANIGLKDAVYTGMAVGMLYALIDSGFGMLSSLCQLRTIPRVSIQPVFNQTVLHVRTQSIMRIRFGYAISAGIRLLLAWKRRT